MIGWALGGLLGAADLTEAFGREPHPVSILLAGDVMLDNGPGHAVANGQDPFADFAAILQSADAAVCNLECTVARTGKQVNKPYTFLARPESLAVVKRHFTAVSLANNHVLDFGRDAFREELGLLERAGIGYFGGGHDRDEAHRPLLLERQGRRLAFLAYNDMVPRSLKAGRQKPGIAWLTERKIVADLRRARSLGRADVVIVFLHWGYELEYGPSPDQKLLARRLIDAGADAIVGAHPHVTQTVDYYQGRPIIYSLGNFVFDYYAVDPPVWNGWLVRLTFGRPGHVDLETMALQIDPGGIPHPHPAPPTPQEPPGP